MKKRILAFSVLLVLCLTLLPHTTALAAPEPNRKASLSLHYGKDGTVFEGLEVGIYRVAEFLPDGSFRLLSPYSAYPIDIHGITEQAAWQRITLTLYSYLVAGGVKPDREVLTDQDGTARFEDLPTGLYFVREAVAAKEDATYVFNHFMVYVPTPQPDGSFLYEVEAKPKCTDYIPKSRYTVTKLWKDGGKKQLRPKEITVDLYRDGILQQTRVLSAENNWSYSWYVPTEEQGGWTVAERDVPEGYKVTIRENGGSISLINTHKTVEDTPSTGDSAAPLLWLLTAILAGVLLLILGIYRRRHK